ncbi:MAG: thioredoxin domain-containing protein [Pseudomonadota bacterium]
MNRLAEETSPYLLQHKDNPVAWWPWGPEALAAAKAENKPILLSVGYAACHWCHVMAHESFENDEIAAEMNRLYINIKVDREERPEIDALYMQALHLLGEQGGWPLTMFLTPDGQPFWGGTYFPPSDRYGRPGFPTVLRGIHQIWSENQDKVEKNVAALSEGLKAWAKSAPGGTVTPEILDEIAEKLLEAMDKVEGGLGGAPKFPNPPTLELLRRAYWRGVDPAYQETIELTLAKMSQGGIYDHLGGGYARYAVDAIWLVPHFEKMLYDNAQLLELLASSWALSGRALFQQRAEETVDWLLTEMRAAAEEPGVAANGRPQDPRVPAFAASYDADSEGEEGLFYLWTPASLRQVLSETEATRFGQAYGVTPSGNFEGQTILNRQHRPLDIDPEEEAMLAPLRHRLYAARAARIWPGWDDKVLADWNGMMIAALILAGRTFGRTDWIAAAGAALDFLAEALMEDGRLHHSWRRGVVKHQATLDDHAHLARAALLLHETTGETKPLTLALTLVELAETHYADSAGGGFYVAAKDAEALIVRAKSAQDSAVASGNGVMVEVLARLSYLTGSADYRDLAERTVAAFTGELGRNFFPLCTLLNAAEFLARAVQVAIIGSRGTAETEALLQAAWQSGNPWLVVQVVEPGEPLPDGHPAKGKTQQSGQATAYVCHGPVCSLPLVEPNALAEALRPMAG